MTEIAGFPVTLLGNARLGDREVVLLGVVPIGAIDRTGAGLWCWSIDLPMVRRMRQARSREDAVRGVTRAIEEWLAAAVAAPPEQRRAAG